MVLPTEKKDLPLMGLGAYGAYEVGGLCARETEKIVLIAMNFIAGPKKEFADLKATSEAITQALSVVPSRGSSAQAFACGVQAMSDKNVWMSDLVDRLAGAVAISGEAGVHSALWAGGIESFTSFWLAWKDKEPRDMVVCVLNGGVRGAIIGLSAERLGGHPDDNAALRMLAAAVVGTVAGMFAAGVGTLAGWGANKISKQLSGGNV